MAESRGRSPGSGRFSARTTLILAGLVIAYVLMQPSLERWLGVELPNLFDGSGALVERSPEGPVVPRSSPDATTDRPRPDSSGVPASGKLGKLRETDNRVLVSTAGLRYRPGSQEGHRVDHVLRHARDDATRPVHGVFDGNRDEILAVIDEAFLITQERGPPDARSEQQDGRTVWTVNLGRRIGYVGGQSGERNDRPAAHHLKLILEHGDNVVSAYPVRESDR